MEGAGGPSSEASVPRLHLLTKKDRPVWTILFYGEKVDVSRKPQGVVALSPSLP